MTGFFVVLEHNQAGGLPRVAVDDVYLNREEAAQLAAALQQRAHPRRDRYTVAHLDLDEEEW